MSAVFLLSIGIPMAAMIGSLVLLIRTGDIRVSLLTALFGFLAIQQGLLVWMRGAAPLGFDVASGVVAAGLLAGVLGALALLVLWRTLEELERAESLHWSAMEGVRALNTLADESDSRLQQRLDALLESGRKHFGLEIGLVSRITGDRWEVVAIQAPTGFPVGRGTVLPLEQTWCRKTLTADRPLDVPQAAGTPWADDPARSALPFEAYLGTSIRVGGRSFGTLAFASFEARGSRFTATHRDLLLLMAHRIGSELVREDWNRRSAARRGESEALRPRAARTQATASPPALDLNASLRKLERRIRRAIGPRIELDLQLAADLAPAREQRAPLDRIILSLVQNAADAMPEGGTLTLATGNLELASNAPDAPTPTAPDRYVTLRVSDTGPGTDLDGLSQAFDAERGRERWPETVIDGERIPIAAIHRMLQRCGADLSTEIEAGRGCIFTVFLPVADGEKLGAEPSRTAAPLRAASPAS